MRRAISWLLVAAVAFAALLAVPHSAESGNRLGLKMRTVKIPFRKSVASVVGGYVDSFYVSIALDAADTTAPIAIGRGMAHVGLRVSPTSNEVPMKLHITALSNAANAAISLAEYSIDGINWHSDGLLPVEFDGGDNAATYPLVATRTLALGGGTNPGENLQLYNYVRFAVYSTGSDLVGARLYLTYFSTEQ